MVMVMDAIMSSAPRNERPGYGGKTKIHVGEGHKAP